MTAPASQTSSLWHARPRPQVTTQRITATLDAVIDQVPSAQPSLLAPLAANAAARVAELFSPESLTGAQGNDVALVDRASGQCVAFATVLHAEGSDFQQRTRLASGVLEQAVWLTRVYVAPTAPAGTQAVLLYAALRQARGWGRSTAAFLMADDETPLARRYGITPLQAVPRMDLAGTGAFRAKAQRLDLMLYHASEEASKAGQPLEPTFLVGEILDTINQLFLDKVGQGRFFQAVDAGTLTREQYVFTLTQLHMFVRWTTRLLGRCVAASNETELRSHFIHHLTGEINHEIIIERDLEHMGEDTTYVKEVAQPNLPTREFMCTQESAVAFYNDPVLMLAAPLAAEGVSGHLGQLFVDKMNALVASWGVKEPARATRFLSSHIEFDGGDDGHWQGNLTLLSKYLRTEVQLRRFLALLRVCVEATLRQWDSYVGDVELWSARPQ
ncbi:MAG: hypothetical protein JXB05_26665 [Myxococcaceae bacterium]|nr:hypothetical protein [Myxococcaceae bacterium]